MKALSPFVFRRRATLLGAAVLSAGLCLAQPTGDSRPASTNIPGAQYPLVHPDRSVTFQLKAPDAAKVQVRVGQTYDMTKAADGTWSVTTPPLVVGFHYYSLVIDGVEVNDPASKTFFGSDHESSGIEIPEPGVDYYDVKDVPHGQIRQQRYFSTVTNAWRRCFIYTPPDYDTNRARRYPVLYLHHGWGEDEWSWVVQGHLDQIMDNLIAAGKSKPMIIVLENHFTALKPGEPRFSFGAGGGRGRGAAGGRGAMGGAAAARPDFSNFGATYTEMMLKDLIPMVEKNYRALTGRDNRAIAGLSMGGLQTFQTALQHLDQFAYIGGFSPGLPGQAAWDKIYADPGAFNKQVKLLWLGTGTVERDGNPNILRLHEDLDKHSIKNVYFESQGTAHEWLTWRRDLADFAPRLFR
ncbi:MAG TPA: alpha/beta hydrolase-fold protein [Bryobacteraceae bacterium]|nr:alpha/beta hydrolase-fold protein [Bryobacteraceae bacterium]